MRFLIWTLSFTIAIYLKNYLIPIRCGNVCGKSKFQLTAFKLTPLFGLSTSLWKDHTIWMTVTDEKEENTLPRNVGQYISWLLRSNWFKGIFGGKPSKTVLWLIMFPLYLQISWRGKVYMWLCAKSWNIVMERAKAFSVLKELIWNHMNMLSIWSHILHIWHNGFQYFWSHFLFSNVLIYSYIAMKNLV